MDDGRKQYLDIVDHLFIVGQLHTVGIDKTNPKLCRGCVLSGTLLNMFCSSNSSRVPCEGLDAIYCFFLEDTPRIDGRHNWSPSGVRGMPPGERPYRSRQVPNTSRLDVAALLRALREYQTRPITHGSRNVELILKLKPTCP